MNMMLQPITSEAEKYLKALADTLALPPGRYRQATERYESLGEYLLRPASTVREYDPHIYVQGSFRLGTANKPWDADEHYDVDSACVMRNRSKADLTQFELKRMLGVEIARYAEEHAMENGIGEGNRCWILEYADGAQFHMDIVPAVPNGDEYERMLKGLGIANPWAKTAIAITDRRLPTYRVRTPDWPRSNPKGYAAWFYDRADIAATRVSDGQMRIRAEVESMPAAQPNRTPLQSAIMILKRHRDQMFADQRDIRPISVIITTLAAHAYQGEPTIGAALVSILNGMRAHILTRNGEFWIPNPTEPLENFAEKWNQKPELERAFSAWLEQAREDFGRAAALSRRQDIADVIAPRIGRSLADRARDLSGGLLTAGLVSSPAVARPAPVRLEGGGRNA